MSFAHPWILVALVAGAVVVWMHLRRRVGTVVPFPPLEILQTVVSHQARRMRVHERILAALRLTSLSCLVTAAASPFVWQWREAPLYAGPPVALALVVDDSASMGHRPASGPSRFEQALTAARREIGRLREQDAVAIVRAATPVRSLSAELSNDKTAALRALSHLSVRHAAQDLPAAVRRAAATIAASRAPKKHIVVITDTTAPDPPASIVPDGIHLRVVRVGTTSTPRNLSVWATRATVDGADPNQVRIRVTVRNWDATPHTVPVTLRVGTSDVATSTVRVPAGAAASTTFSHRTDAAEPFVGSVRIPPDELAADNRRAVALAPSQPCSLLILNGEPQPGYRDEVFYFLKALEAGAATGARIGWTTVTPETLGALAPADFDAVAAAGINRLDDDLATRLHAAVTQGTNLLLCPGTTPRWRDLTPLLPAPIDGVRTLPADKPEQLGAFAWDHSVLREMTATVTGLENTAIARHLTVRPQSTPTYTTIMSTASGLPLLLEHAVGAGSVLTWLTSLDRDWTDMPIQPGYVPWVASIVGHLCRHAAPPDIRHVAAGTAVALRLPAKTQTITITAPSGTRYTVGHKYIAGKQRYWFHHTEEPGFYAVRMETAAHGAPAGATPGFLVHVPRSEFRVAGTHSPTLGTDGTGGRHRERTPIGTYFLIVGLVAVIAETLVSALGMGTGRGSPAATTTTEG